MTLTAIPNPTSGTLLSDIITWVRRIVKTPSNQALNDFLIADYINRFVQYDLPERVQLFELKRQYTFETIPNIYQYQFPYQLYQNLVPPAYSDGLLMGYYQDDSQFYGVVPETVNNEQPILGDGTAGPYTVTFGGSPILRSFVDDLGNNLPYVFITGLDSSSTQHYVVDGPLITSAGPTFGFNLYQTDSTFQFAPDGVNPPIACGTVDYVLGTATFTFDANIVDQTPITTQTIPYSPGQPRFCLFFNNSIKLFPVPDRAYKIQFDAYITPAQFLNTSSAEPFAYMSEYIARGAARKILTDNGDYDQFAFYEPLFREQENLVLRRTSRINSNVRTPTIFSGQTYNNPFFYGQR